jgi:hypothetical protein
VNEHDDKKIPTWHSHEYLPEAESFGDQFSLHGRCPDLVSEFQCAVRPNEVVVAAKQLEVILEALFPSRVANRSPAKIHQTLSDREIQPFDERRVRFRRVLGVAQRLFQSPRRTNHRSSLDPDYTIVPARFDNLAVETRWAEDATDYFLVELESVRGD